MGLFRRKRPGPDWAEPLSQDETDDFVEAVARELERRGLEHEVEDGLVKVTLGGDPHDLGLSNLAQYCHLVGRDSWQDAIAEHFDNLFASLEADAGLDERVGDFASIRSLLKVRLYPDATQGGLEAMPPAGWGLAPGLMAALVYDLPTTVRVAKPEEVEAWGMSNDELLSVALENVRGEAVEATPLFDGKSAPIACFADHFFAASHALLLEERLPPEANGEAVFAVPHRHALLYAPMVDMSVAQSINHLIALADSMFREGPGSISPDLYWWLAGSVTLLPSESNGRTVQFFPPSEFVQALERLASAS